MVEAKTLMVPDYLWDRVVAAVEREFPNGTVTRFPDELQENLNEGIEEYFIVPKDLFKE